MQITTPTGTYKWTSDTFGTLFINEDFTLSILSIRGDNTIQLWERERYGYPTYHTPEQLVKLGYMELVEETIDVQRTFDLASSGAYFGNTKPFKLIDTSPESCKKELEEDIRRFIKKEGISPKRFFEIIDEVNRELPEEKQTYWYIETEEMKKSEYWEVFKEWYTKNADWKIDFTASKYGFHEGLWTMGENGQQKLSPYTWYDTIYDREKDDGLLFGNGDKKGSPLLPDHDKAMEIAEVPEDYDDNPFTPLGIDNQRKQMAKSLNAVIRVIRYLKSNNL